MKARWATDERIRPQMADVTQRSFRVRQPGRGGQRTVVMKITALSRREGKNAALPAKTQPVMSHMAKSSKE